MYKIDALEMIVRSTIFAMREVEYAILEPNGNLSALRSPDQKAPTRSDLKLPAVPIKYLPTTEVIKDGRIVDRNLSEFGLNRKWLEEKLDGINAKQVFYAELQEDGSLSYQLKQP